MCAVVDDVTGRQGAAFKVGKPVTIRGAGARALLRHAGLPFAAVTEVVMTPTSESGPDGRRKWTLRAQFASGDALRNQLTLTSDELGLEESSVPARAFHRRLTLVEAAMTLGLMERGFFKFPGSDQEYEIVGARASVDDQ